MLDNDNIISTSVSEAVEKIPTDEKDYRKCSFMCFTLHSHSIQREILVALYFFEAYCQKRGLNFSWGACNLDRNYVMVVTFLSFRCNYDNLTLKLH